MSNHELDKSLHIALILGNTKKNNLTKTKRTFCMNKNKVIFTLLLILSWCDGITDRDIASITTNCKNLEEIHYAYCMQYDEFSLECYYNITGENIRYLIEGCPQLKCSFWIGIFHQQRLLRSFPRAPQQI